MKEIKNYFRSRYQLLKSPKILGDIFNNIGLGVFINAIYNTSVNGIDLINFIDIMIAIFVIIESSVLKERE
jgi:hypothetical protein